MNILRTFFPKKYKKVQPQRQNKTLLYKKGVLFDNLEDQLDTEPYKVFSDLLRRRVQQITDFTQLYLKPYERYITNFSFQKYLIISRNLTVWWLWSVMQIWREI